MGGAIKSWVKEVGNQLEDLRDNTGDIIEGSLQGDLGKIGDASLGNLEIVTGVRQSKNAFNTVVAGINEVTGVTAMQERLQQEAELSASEARRRALISDAMARNQGGEDAKITLNSQRNRRKGNASATGIAGMDTSVKTGVQG